MGCFLACFGSSKSKRRKQRHNVQRNATSKPEQPSVSLVQDHSKTVLSTVSELQGKSEEQLSIGSRKKVTFDSNVKTYEPVLLDEVADFKKSEEERGKEEALAKPSQSKSSPSEDNSVTSTGSYPSNHRYQNCRDSDGEEELDYGASDLSDEDGDEDGDCDIREEYNEQGEDFEGEGVVYSRARTGADHVVTDEVESPIPTCERDVKSIGSNPNTRDRSVYVHPVLNPVENLTQWKAVKSKRTLPLRPQKENHDYSNHESRIAFGAAEPSVKELSFSLNSETDTSKKLNQEIRVDASLSNWLGSSESTTTTPPVNKGSSVALHAGTPDRSTSQGSNTVISHDDRPILGALTVEEIKQFSATSSPRKSPSRSPDEMPIIGTVGTYWNFTGSEDSGSASSFKGIPNTTSKYREDKRVNWHSTPFETRLEKALNRGGAAEAASSTYVPRVF